jgi:hypothetical protein
VAHAVARGVERIVLCTGSYGERLVIDDVDQPIEVYGGFDCSKPQWVASSSGGTTVEPSSGVPLRIKSMVEDVWIENVAFEAADATDAGESSLAAILESNVEVTLKDVTLTAGKGKDAEGGEETEGFDFPMTSACVEDDECLEGRDAVGTLRGAARTYGCPGGAPLTGGGRGGDGAAIPDDGNDGSPDRGLDAGGDAAAGVDPCGPGQVGGAGSDGSNASGADTTGTAASSTWNPSPGSDGQHGQVGQGGGGGGATSGSANRPRPCLRTFPAALGRPPHPGAGCRPLWSAPDPSASGSTHSDRSRPAIVLRREPMPECGHTSPTPQPPGTRPENHCRAPRRRRRRRV